MSNHLKVYDESAVKALCFTRANEKKAWQAMSLLDTHVDVQQALVDAAEFGMRYVLLGICEDIGPKANLGNGGANEAWHAFLAKFLNQPHNQFIATQKVLLLGEVNVDDLMAQSSQLNNKNPEQLQQLRLLCQQLDERVESALNLIFKAGLEPIVIGGGHNNCLGIIRALSKTQHTPVNAINFDPHADFRECEGRHSGNGFRYAYNETLLNNYHVIGLHEQKNNQAIVDAMTQANFTFDSYQSLNVKRDINLTQSINNAINSFDSLPLGVEVDLDSITFMPVSAYTCCGFSVGDTEHFVYTAASSRNAKYLHLCEASPSQHPNGPIAGTAHVGQVISALVNSFILAREAKAP
ncbi:MULTISPECIES: formimidoylglutamase [unclassified Pseudoalteromonas]|uniref:formimidoylglutamase n=1 Tax=unclassified Pseudoalteromonas TaxID=194690 RepID=UPI0011081138|nr:MULTISPECIES: formimidoylglutamase [unclassified Pseudoalteromonas]TMN78042.1 arginase [Pseudoalteromonas sp. S410]TMN89199.1 arginase [Pseudoalteromonas sp. S408]TMN95905.1 arginase [Pseudoalteromonas sp. S409]TMN99100.1 arginase [Pseudoalteromonas sp. S407]TMO11041.1 arginase [Pseudoalteromonas sp. S186]